MPKLIEKMSVEEVEGMIVEHVANGDCKLNEKGTCSCLFWKQVLMKKKMHITRRERISAHVDDLDDLGRYL